MTEWHAIRARPGAEGKALIGIEAMRMGGFLPVELVRKTRLGERQTSWLPLFPGYLFARIDPGRDLPRLREVEGVAGILRPGGRFARVPDAAIEAIRFAQEAGAFDRTGTISWLAEGDDVRVLAGPFAGLIAKVQSAKTGRRAQILVDFVHKLTLGVDKLEKIRA